MRELLALMLVLVLTLGAGTAAMAAWATTGAGSATTTSGSLIQPSSASASVLQSTVTIEWTAGTLSGGAAVDGYRVLRVTGDTVTPAGGTCTGIVTGLTCSEDPVDDTHLYQVIALKGETWASDAVTTGQAVVPADKPSLVFAGCPTMVGRASLWQGTLQRASSASDSAVIVTLTVEGTGTVTPETLLLVPGELQQGFTYQQENNNSNSTTTVRAHSTGYDDATCTFIKR